MFPWQLQQSLSNQFLFLLLISFHYMWMLFLSSVINFCTGINLLWSFLYFFNFLGSWPFPWQRQPFWKNQPLKAQLHMAYHIPTRFQKVWSRHLREMWRTNFWRRKKERKKERNNNNNNKNNQKRSKHNMFSKLRLGEININICFFHVIAMWCNI